jgi:aryl-alcohol dehydrogenase-like predicted oxidoreductase
VRYDSLQPHYNLAHRAEYERELKEVCLRFGLGVIPYSPLAGGFLTGKYTRDSAADSARAESIKRRYFNEAGWRVLDAVKAVAAELGSTPTAISLAWLLAQPEMTAPIIGANSVQQLQASLAACDLNLTEEQMATLNQASAWQAGV